MSLAGLFKFGFDNRSWIPKSICFKVIDGFQSWFSIDKQTAPLGNIFGWKIGGTNTHFGGLVGYDWGKVTIKW